MQTLTIGASVRPGRVAVLCDIDDAEWLYSCRHILEIFSTVWGGHGNIIIPTDGTSIQPLFWQILEKFDPDYIYAYSPTWRDVEERDPQTFDRKLDEVLTSWGPEYVLTENMINRARSNVRRERRSNFAISPQLAQELKARITPFFYEEIIVGPGTWTAGEIPGYPHTRILDILPEIDHGNKIILPARTLNASESLWYSAAIGSCNDEFATKLEEAGVRPFRVGDGSGTNDPIEEQRKLVNFVVERASLEQHSGLDFINPGSPLPETVRFTLAELSLLNQGWYKRLHSNSWAPKAVAVAGNTVSDFCLYFGLSQLRERVFWIFPPITEAAHSGKTAYDYQSPIASFAHSLRMATDYVQQYALGLDMVSSTLNAAGLRAVKAQLDLAARAPLHIDIIGKAADVVPDYPLRVLDRSNAHQLRVVHVPDSRVIELFETPKPTAFRRINPSTHHWITELELQSQQPAQHPALGTWYVGGKNQSTNEVRTSADGLAYFCPGAAFLIGQDIDSVTVRPNIRVPEPREIFEKVAELAGLNSTISDKGFYAQDAIAKLGGLEKAAEFFRSASGRSLIAAYLDKKERKEGVYDKGVFLGERRYLSAGDLVRALKTVNQAVTYIDDFSRRGILYRGYLFQCEFCRNAAWYPLKDVSDRFTCLRCHREQVFTSKHWKMPRCQPSLYYQLDEVVYQGFSNDMSVPTLTLDCLRRSAQGSFLYVEELGFRKGIASKPIMECDVNCIIDGVLTIGEAKSADQLGNTRGAEVALIKKYQSLAASLGARRIVFATQSEKWASTTAQNIQQVLGKTSLDVRLLTAAELFKA